jgi:hypothetical protein
VKSNQNELLDFSSLMTMLFFLRSVFVLLLFNSVHAFSVEEKEIEVIPNPHARELKEVTTCGSSLQNLLQPHLIVTQPKLTQEGSLEEIFHAKVFTVPVPIYRMKQPYRISTAELQFDLVLVRDIPAKESIRFASVDPVKSKDSWFPGFSWTPIVHQCAGDYQHVGWKFEADSGDFFYALLVQVDPRKKEYVVIESLPAANWMIAAIRS